ncbi:MAG: uracil-DNA glycosylase family protein [Polyangiaceae bacterium]
MPSIASLATDLRDQVGRVRLTTPAFVYSPLFYAWPVAEKYLKLGRGKKRAVFVGMNPGPFGMAQTGVPFGEVAAVRDWMRLGGEIGRPEREHPKRPVLGFDCKRSEVSGKRLWGAFSAKSPDPKKFFDEAFVLNYCPLLFLTESGTNLTPDKLTKKERDAISKICDEHLRAALDVLDPEVAIGVGQYATDRLRIISPEKIPVSSILHPSPASPAANRDWIGDARKSLAKVGLGHLM